MIRRPWIVTDMPQIGVSYLIYKDGPLDAVTVPTEQITIHLDLNKDLRSPDFGRVRLSFWMRIWLYLNKDLREVWTDIKSFWRI